MRPSLFRVVFALSTAGVLAGTGPVLAVDGVVLIDQNRALAGSVTPGDAPGFPVDINGPGTFRLSGNLTLPSGGTTGIKINSGNVTLDLNGFTIIGASQLGTGIGIDGTGVAGVKVMNGNVFGAGAAGIMLGSVARVESVLVSSTVGSNNVDGDGIVVGVGSSVRNCTSNGNARWGILALDTSTITGNTLDQNQLGIKLTNHGTVTGNTVSQTGGIGIETLQPGNTVIGNTVIDGAYIGLVIYCPSNIVDNTLFGYPISIQELGTGCTKANNVGVP